MLAKPSMLSDHVEAGRRTLLKLSPLAVAAGAASIGRAAFAHTSSA